MRGKSWLTSIQERHLLFKLDALLITFGCLGTFIKYIDKSNLQSAYVSGMEQDLKLYGNVRFSGRERLISWLTSIASNLTMPSPAIALPM